MGPPTPSFRPAPRGTTLRERLARFPFLQDLPDAALDALAREARSIRFDAPTPLVLPGQQVSVVPLVERGAIRVERGAEDGKRIALYRVPPGETCVLALSGAIRDEAYPAEAIAEPGTEAIALSADALARAYEAEPALRRFVLETFAARLYELMHLVREVSFERVETRLARLMLREAEAGPGVYRPVELSHAAIASRLGTAREVVTRALATLRDEGIVELGRGRITVLAPEALRALTTRAG